MPKFFKWFLIPVLVLGILAFGVLQIVKYRTKLHSPQDTVVYSKNGFDIEVAYSRPFKKERKIFGGLVPYGKVWRTGANEATTFKTKTDLYIEGQKLPAGKYTLWTIPGAKSWKVIFNSGHPSWGVDLHEEAARDPKLDVVNVEVRSQRNFMVYEQFTIEIDHTPPDLMLEWDFTRVDVPLQLRK